MKKLKAIMTLVILIGCGQKNLVDTQTKVRTENVLESEKATKTQSNEVQKENESKTMCNCDGVVDWQKDVKVTLYDHPNGKKIDTLTHDIKGEDFLTFTIYDSKDEFFKVKIGRAIDGQQKIGWIKKEKYLGIYARNYSDDDIMYLYTKPDLKSEPTNTINKYYPELYSIIDCEGKWTKVSMKMDGKEFKGWLEPEMQCSNPYTTCN